VSYAWADESNPTLEEKVDEFCQAAQEQGIMIFRDKTTLVRGDRISEFMSKLGEGDRIFVFFSKKYLQSPYCMFEMFEIWRNSRQDRREFLRHVKLIPVDDARISGPNAWIQHVTYWLEECDLLGKEIDKIGWRVAGEAILKRYWVMQKFVGELSNVLELFADVVSARNIGDFREGELFNYAFGDLYKAPRIPKSRLDREPLQNIT
jgi:internalin A